MIPGEGVLLSDERGSRLLTGSLVEALVPLLDGELSVEDIVKRLEADHPPAGIYYALMQLEAAGHVRAAVSEEAGADHPGFRDAIGVRTATRPGVALTFGPGVATDGWSQSLERLGCEVDDDAPLVLRLTDDYQAPDLESWNLESLGEGRRWLLCRPTGTVVWVGPLFVPGETACWECLRARLERTRPVETYLTRRRSPDEPLVPPTASRATVQAAAGLVATQIARIHADPNDGGPRGVILRLDTVTLEAGVHRVDRRPQCPACGDPDLYASRPGSPIELRPVRKRFTADGGHRAVSPEETVERLLPLVDPVTGVIAEVHRFRPRGGVGHVFSAGANYSRPAADLTGLRTGIRRASGGKGWTDAVARAGAMGEAVERYSGVFQGDEPRVRADIGELGARAIPPGRLLQLSARQLRDLGAESAHDEGPEHLDLGPIEWTPVWSLTAREPKYVPTALLYYGYRGPGPEWLPPGDSNGAAAGNTIEEACGQGLLELIERDSVALWWYNRARRPGIDPDSFDADGWTSLREHYRALDRRVWILDITSDIGVPVFAAVSGRVGAGRDEILVGVGAHLDPRIAFKRSVSEMNQMLVFLEEGGRTDLEPSLARWLSEATMENQSYLCPDPERQPIDLATIGDGSSTDLAEDVRELQRRIEAAGIEVLALDQTRPDVRMPVVKMIAPGLRHFRPRFGDGRLFRTPVELGWLDQPKPEGELNPFPFFL
ncbi:MAG: TOMM precursor leader peptide-binding protein [Gemmatimonadota bacterium]|nr:TOMM precursor leader peptide-binding protein [Gemmatimonadota bacterium]